MERRTRKQLRRAASPTKTTGRSSTTSDEDEGPGLAASSCRVRFEPTTPPGASLAPAVVKCANGSSRPPARRPYHLPDSVAGRRPLSQRHEEGRKAMNQDPLYLYRREGAYIPRVAAVHDLCGYGKCSLGVAIPGARRPPAATCAPCPPACSPPTRRSPAGTCTTPPPCWPTTWRHWKNIGVEIDAVYSGFLGAPEQVDRIRDLYALYPDRAARGRPGDGRPRQGVPHLHARALRRHGRAGACGADILTPNLTEAAIILGEPIGDDWAGTDISDDGARTGWSTRWWRRARSTWCSRASSARASRCIRNFVGGEGMDAVEVQQRVPALHAARHRRPVRIVPDGSRHGGPHAARRPCASPATSCTTPCS